jgi:putative restriction endonuclease
MKFWVGTTDSVWFQFLSTRAFDEVNLCQPSSLAPFKTTDVGMPFLFKLKRPCNPIAGGGYFVGHSAIPFGMAWEIFGEKNGAESFRDLNQRLIGLRHAALDPMQSIGCQIISSPVFLPKDRWLANPPGWSPNIVRGRMYDTAEADGAAIWSSAGGYLAARQTSLLSEPRIAAPAVKPEVEEPQAYGAETIVRPRLGQGAFRLLLTDLYKRRCAITGESTLPTLEAAHIVPYAESGSHELDNGLLMRADFHKLFDLGLVGVSPDLTIKVSPRIREAWFNGKAYYGLDGKPVAVVPDDRSNRPDPNRLDWHMRNVFQD